MCFEMEKDSLQWAGWINLVKNEIDPELPLQDNIFPSVEFYIF